MNIQGEPMESHYTADSCAQYLAEFYILPHTYKYSIRTRYFLPFFYAFIFIYAITSLVPEFDSLRNQINSSKSLEFVVGLVCTAMTCGWFPVLSPMWQKTVITRHSIDITLSLSKTSISSKNIAGYALDSVIQA